VKLALIAAGRLKSGPQRDLFEEYSRRLAWPIAVTEIEERRPLAPAELKAREGALIEAALDAAFRKLTAPVLVALDERGLVLSSAAFAERLQRWRDGGRDAVFVIGGAEGLARPVLERAELTLSLGAMTWPHLLVRVLLAEQIYRAQTILARHPYHRA
jgi:23S rRNA (pseudouridine1915-N3)-methyltransferase